MPCRRNQGDWVFLQQRHRTVFWQINEIQEARTNKDDVPAARSEEWAQELKRPSEKQARELWLWLWLWQTAAFDKVDWIVLCLSDLFIKPQNFLWIQVHEFLKIQLFTDFITEICIVKSWKQKVTHISQLKSKKQYSRYRILLDCH